MTTTTEPRARRMSRKERAAHARAQLARERAARGLDALTEADAWNIIRAGVRRAMAAGRLSEAERDCLTSEVMQRATRSAGVATRDGWRIPRSRLSGDWVTWTARRLARDQRTWKDVADPDALPRELDDYARDLDAYGRERLEWVTRAPEVDADALARRLSADLSGATPETLRVGLMALMAAERGRGGTYVYGPALAERLGVSLAGLRKMVQRTRDALTERYPDPGALADAIMGAAATLPGANVQPATDGATLSPLALLAERAISAALVDGAKRARAFLSGGASHLPGRPLSAEPGTEPIPCRHVAHWQERPPQPDPAKVRRQERSAARAERIAQRRALRAQGIDWRECHA